MEEYQATIPSRSCKRLYPRQPDRECFLGDKYDSHIMVGYHQITDLGTGIQQCALVRSLRGIYDDVRKALETETESLNRVYNWGFDRTCLLITWRT